MGSVCKSSFQINFATETLYRIAFFNYGTELLISDELKGLIHICDINGKKIDSMNPEYSLQQPLGLFVSSKNGKEEIYVGDYYHHQIFVFCSNLELIKKFGDHNLKIPQFLEIDNEDQDKLLFVSDTANNEITVWNIEQGTFFERIEIEQPFNMKFTKDALFVIGCIDIKVDESDKLIEIERGFNGIFIVNKFKPFNIMRKIEFENWITSSGLFINIDRNIYTLAYELNKEKKKSLFKSLFIFDFEGKLIKKINLDGVKAIGDMLIINNRVCITSSNCIRLFDFE